MAVNKAAFTRVCKELDEGKALTFGMVGDVFGSAFWEMLVIGLMDAQDAAIAIQGAIRRLSGREVSEDEG